MFYLLSPSHHPQENLALEEYLALHRKDDECFLLLYRNTPSVIIGRNQNPFQEANFRWCMQTNTALLRRISGGGTVYHDLGNLNVAFFTPRSEYIPDKYVGIILKILQEMGLPNASIQGQHSIWSGKHKVSGSAFALNKNGALMHSCLLVETELTALSQSLKKLPNATFEGASVASVPAPVENIHQLVPSITIDSLLEELPHRIAQSLGTPLLECDATPLLQNPDLQPLIAKYGSADWNWNRTPEFILSLPFPEGTLRLTVTNGIITQAQAEQPGQTVSIPEFQEIPLPRFLLELNL